IKLNLTDEDGRFTFSDLAPGDYRLRVMGIGYADYDTDLFTLTEGQQLELPTLNLRTTGTDLQTVEVTARKPFLEQRAGRLVVNVDQSLTGQGGSVTDLLKKVPGLIVVGNRVSMAGQQGLTILIDGRPTKFMDIQSLLREMPADNIARIEVISQPGAAFDAEGTGGVINIILKKNSLLGTNGSVYVGGGYGELAKYRTGLNLSHRVGNLNLTTDLSYGHNSWLERLDLVRTFDDRVFLQSNYTEGLPHSYSGRVAADYDLTDRHRIGVGVRGQYTDSPKSGSNLTRIVDPETLEERSRLITETDTERSWQSVNADAFYRFQIDTSGRELTVDGAYSSYSREAVNRLITTGADFPDRRNEEPAETGIRSMQLDYKHPIGTKILLRTGGKISAARIDNAFLADVRNPLGEWVVDAGLTNTFVYDEDIRALYLSGDYTHKKIEISGGVRFEDTKTNGFSATLDSTVARNFNQFFPSVSLNAPVSKVLGIAAAYSYRIERPSYYDLNPFVSFIDPFTFQRGNPFLRPELTHSAKVSLTYEKQPFFNLSYDLTDNVMSEVTEQDAATGAAFQTDVNLDRYVRYGGSLFFPLDFIAKPISGYGGVMVFYHDYDSEYLGGQLDQDQWSLTGFMQVNANLPRDWKLEVTGWYQGSTLEGIIRSEALYGVDLGLQKTFLDDRLELRLSGDGVIQKFFRGRIDYQEQDIAILSRWEAPTVNGKLTYR
ncbi:MAG: outer membrane beta-barrel protein, partial [Saprospiraceae bacterium]